MSKIDPIQRGGVTIVYDGECPLCRSYVRLYRIRDLVGQVRLIDARTSHPLIDEIARRNLDLDEGMVVYFDGHFFHGASAMQVLALLGSSDSTFNTLNRIIFRHPRLARIIYPFLVRGRGLLLRLLGRRLISES